ncbi:16318_t:CDS:2 [Acaulospora colombiana]|uniref:16318_t:CDS:1 n=1 Tax=Acaulospora colombiana TaxID=27376 RepID=A0ACA9LNE7_9GLOM|nr:16318_t:CDS:2 [Acaulospora colombiana]
MERKNSDIETNANVEMEETYSMSNATTDVDAYMDVDDASTHNMTAAAAQLTYNAVSTFAPFIPYVDSIFAVIEEIIKIYDNVEYNKKTCRILVDRVETVNMVIRKLVRRKDEEKLFCNQDYYHAFIRLDQTLKIIKRFVRDVSQYKNFRKVLFAKNIQEECQDLIRKLETACDDLKFGIIISLEEKQREQAILKEDFENMINMMDSWDEKLNLITAQISEMKNTDHKLKVDIIEPTRLSGRTTMTRGKIIKKITREDNVHTTAKLANFNFSREINQGSIEINDISELVRWMAPEKLIRGGKPRNYTYPCEVFR